MKKVKIIGFIFIFNYFLSACGHSFLIESDFVKQNIRTVKQIGGSINSGDIIFNKNKSLSCRLKEWELIGVFKNNNLVTTQGEFVFEITNHNPKNQNWVIFELLILDKERNVLTTSNPFRKLQGEILIISPPIEKDQSRLLVREWKYRSGWHDVTLKSCQWANSPDDYWEKYPELKDYPAP